MQIRQKNVILTAIFVFSENCLKLATYEMHCLCCLCVRVVNG